MCWRSGEISGNSTAGNGGGINNEGKLIMNGGTIYNNTADGNGGGVNHARGTFTLDGGWIFNNHSSDDDVYIGQGGIFNNNVHDVNIGAIGSPPPDFEY